ncbi:flagellar basal body rod protein FlgB [Azorhizobium sp. AG788]|uniref:flagellar basal body rod protein FlgB n=1 Tax=Azorhizobium sp. AG788 TaxID=2183897 RepID=UPI0032AF44A9
MASFSPVGPVPDPSASPVQGFTPRVGPETIREDPLDPLYLFDLASRQARWASVRQATITGNIANANTPGYQAREVEPFSAVMNKTRLSMATTEPGHMGVPFAGAETSKTKESDSWEVTASGNSVNLDQEMLKAADVNRTYTLNTNIVRAFNRMILTSVRSS